MIKRKEAITGTSTRSCCRCYVPICPGKPRFKACRLGIIAQKKPKYRSYEGGSLTLPSLPHDGDGYTMKCAHVGLRPSPVNRRFSARILLQSKPPS